jgi:rhomboid protease GluP
MDPAGERARHYPWVTIFLALANVGVFVWELSAGADPMMPTPQWMMEHGGNFGPLTLGGEQWRLVTSMFLHYGVVHIGMNMIGLIDGGRHVERMYGRAGFIALYLVSGLAASLATSLRDNVVSAGASGAIFGVFGAFGAFLFLHRDRLDRAEVSKQSRGLLIFLAYNIYFGLTAKGIDLVAHIGGLVAGFVVGLALEAGTSEDHSTRRRSLIVAVLGVALVAGGAYLAPRPHNALSEFGEIEEPILDQWNQLVKKAQAGTATDEELADAIEKDILPAWRKLEDTFEKDSGEEKMRPLVLQYLRARREGWEMMAPALRAHDGEKVQAAMARFKEGDAAIERMKKQQD